MENIPAFLRKRFKETGLPEELYIAFLEGVLAGQDLTIELKKEYQVRDYVPK